MERIGIELWDFFKKNFAILVAATIFMVFYFNGCGNKQGQGKPTIDTTVRQILQPIVINPPYTPQQAGNTVYVPIPQNSQQVIPASTMAELIEQVKQLSKSREDLAREYYAIRNYNDSITLKDTAGNRVGVVNLKQTVSENILKSTQPTYQLIFPETTITKTIPAKLKNQVFFGATVQSPINSPKIGQIDLGLLLKNKKENILSLSGTYDLQSNQSGIRVGYYQKLSFKPKI